MEIDATIDTPFARFFARRGFALAMAIAVVLGLSTTLLGFFVDDYVHLLSLEGKVPTTSTFDLFKFASGKPGEIQKVMGFLPFPWFTDLDVKLHFFRPLSCATMALDRVLFGRNPIPFHVHSALWYLAFVAGCWLVFKRALPPALAGLAIVLFSVDFGHLLATAWWSNRNALCAATPAVFGLWAHMRWREDGWRWGLPVSLLGYGLGLLGGEMALCVFGFVGAYELIGDRGPFLKRISALAPGAILGVTYLLIYQMNGFGTRGSGVYIDPVSAPMEFIAHAPERIIMLIAAQFFLVPVEVVAGNAAAYWPLMLASIVAVGLTVHLARISWKDFDDDTHRGLIWLVVGALISCGPVLSTFASARLLVVPSIGAIPLLAAILLHLRAPGLRPTLRLAFGVLMLLHAVIAPLAWPALCIGVRRLDAVMHATISRTEIDNSHAGEQIVVVPVAPEPMTAMYTVIIREFDGAPRVKSWNALSMAQCAHRISRTAPNRIELELVDGEFLNTIFELLMRQQDSGFKVGDKIKLPQFTVEVLGMGKRNPNRVAFEFAGNLDEPPYLILGWKEDRLARTTLPPVGQSVELPFDPGILKLKYLLASETD